MKEIYLGFMPTTLKFDIFKSDFLPTSESHGYKYSYVIGPFRTMRGAIFMRDSGQGNPHCQCVADAERLGLKYQKRKFAEKNVLH